MARVARPVVPAAPIESYTVVMATGIAAVAARENEHPAVALVLAVLAGCGLIAVVAWVALARAGSGRGMKGAAGRVDHACALFGFVAAADVVAAQFDLPAATGVVVLLGAVAAVAWVVLMVRMTAVVNTCGWAAIRAGARGSWLLVVVATQSVVLTAARLAVVAGGASGALIVVSVVGWLTGVLAYLVIVPLVVRRVVAARMAPALLTPDAWVLMGASAITVVAGGTVVDAARSGALAAAGSVVVVGCWVVATAWIPVLVGAEWHRYRHQRLRYEHSRWCTVFPLGMYVVAGTTVAATTPLTGLRGVAATLYWVALATWCATTAGAALHALERRWPRRA